MKSHSRFKVARKFLIFWCLFIGVGALFGGTSMLLKPDGSILHMQALLPYFQILPFSDVLFQNYIFSGISLLCVNGFTNIIAAFLLFKSKKAGIITGGIFGVTLMLWICIQFVIFPMNFMSTTYFFFGLAQALTGYATWVFYKQESFSFNESDYKNIGTNDKKLVVYFSRLGYTKKLAFDEAEKTGAKLYEIKSTERTEGTTGFWWCGRFAMHRWEMPIELVNIDLTSFDSVTICSPIWVFSLAAPVRAFCKAASGKIKKVDYVFIHHMHSDFKNAADEADSLLGIKHSDFISVRCHLGKI